MPDVFWYLPTYVTYAKILAHVRDHVRQFYGNCRTLQWQVSGRNHVNNTPSNFEAEAIILPLALKAEIKYVYSSFQVNFI